MATVTTPTRAPSLPPAPAPAADSPPAVLDPMRPHLGDRIAFGVWVTCALFMAALLTYDTIIAMFR
ncbi:MAG TPA: hypothetical protein VFW33_07770 [Gemmataceae bacterium]|nr:hypothetical protein [Gemmataceae bacterium]